MAIRPQPKSFLCFETRRWQALRLLLVECADLRADLVTVHGLHSDGEDDGVFAGRQQDRILELQDAATGMAALLASLPNQPGGEAEEAGNE